MDVTYALLAARWCGARRIVGMHYDTFPPIQIDHAAALAQATAAGFYLKARPRRGAVYRIEGLQRAGFGIHPRRGMPTAVASPLCFDTQLILLTFGTDLLLPLRCLA